MVNDSIFLHVEDVGTTARKDILSMDVISSFLENILRCKDTKTNRAILLLKGINVKTKSGQQQAG